MEFKFLVKIILSKEVSVEADNPVEAMDKLQEMMSGPQNMNDFQPTEIQYEALSFGVS